MPSPESTARNLSDRFCKVINTCIHTIQNHLRTKRMVNLASRFKLTENTLVLDVGGTEDIWALSPIKPKLIFLNQARARLEVGNSCPVVLGDARHLPFADQSFDVVFSNSVIEHVGTSKDQSLFASEIIRVGRQYWVETPDRAFPIEQHVWTPFVHWLPKRWQRRALANFCVWAFVRSASPQERTFYLEHYLRSIRLLTASELLQLFPGGKVHTERILGLSKALIVCSASHDNGSSKLDGECNIIDRCAK